VSPELTVCIPAYRSEAFLQNTLLSLLSQSYSNFCVEIAIEPPAEAVLKACAPLLHDERVGIVINPEVLGWAENIKRLLNRVKTPYFMILFHDDLLVNDYISSLLWELKQRPQASVAYGDMICFGQESFRWRLRLTDEPTFDRLMSFFLGGTEAVPVRGVARSSVLDNHDFPTDQYGGFACECEWVLHLLLAGQAIHVPRPLYLKRIFGPNEVSVSSKRLRGHSREYLLEALEHHRANMLALIRRADLPKQQRVVVELAGEAAVLRRHMTFNMGAFSPIQLARLEQIMSNAAATLGNYSKGIEAMLLLTMSRHALAESDGKSALEFAIAAVDANPVQPEGLIHLSRLQLAAGNSIEAFNTALRAWTVEPDGRGQRELIADCENTVEQRKILDMMRNGQVALIAERFDAAAYLNDHPDVASACIDPWQHFCEFGWREGRKIGLLPTLIDRHT
jgi:hypothetical protein